MSKPLTIDELKALETGDWVYIKRLYADCSVGTYYELGTQVVSEKYLVVELGNYERYNFSYSDYGTKWIAYKNKEFAETKGEYIEFPCIRKVTNCIHGVGEQETVWRIYIVRDEKLCHYVNGIDFMECKTEEQAQKRLKELQGESK